MATKSFSPETGTKDNVVNVDSSVVTSFNNNAFEVDIKANNFADEVYTLNYIGNIFSNLQNIFTSCQNLINSARKYVENADEADRIKMPDIAEFNFSFSGTEEFKQAQVDSFNGSMNTTGIVSTSSGTLNLRSGAGTNNDVIASLSKDTKLKIINNDSSSNWIEVETEDGKRGFVAREYIKIQSLTPSVSQTTPTSTSVDVGVQKVVLHSGHLNVRSDPSTNNSPIGSLKNGDEVKVLESNSNWTKIEFNNQEAYVATKYLSGGK